MIKKINDKERYHLLFLFRSGYSLDSVYSKYTKEFKRPDVTRTDLVLLAKSAGIKSFGKKDLKSEKIDIRTLGANLPTILENTSVMRKVKIKLLLLLICVVVLLFSIFILTDLNTTLIISSALFCSLFIFILVIYFKYIRSNKCLPTKFFKKK